VISGARDLGSDRVAIREAYAKADMKSDAARAELRRELRGAMLRHPAEPYFPLVGALVAWLGRDQEPMPWLQRALEREPLNGRAHLLLADVLAARGAKAQALLELRLAAENDATLVANAAAAALKLTRAYEELLRAVPEGKAGAASLDELGVRLAAMGERVARSQCDREAIARDPALVSPRMREADELIRALTPGSRLNLCADRGWCEREIEAHAAAIALSRPRSSLPTQLRARKLLAEGRADDADKMLQTECGRATDRADCLRLRVDAAAQVKAPDRLALAIKDFLAASCARAPECADAATLAANVRADRGEWGAAVALYARAAREDATEERLLRLAEAASRSGAHAEAADALERVGQKRGGADPELRRRIDEQRSLAAGVLIKP
jgi:tetratricopeptide (TPR) repeat protein